MDRFVDIIDRYLEVSNVYSQRIDQVIADSGSGKESQKERAQRLVSILENVDLRAAAKPVPTVTQANALGQSVAPTKDVLLATKKYQSIVLERFTKGRSSLLAPRNSNRLVGTLKLPPEQFLACFSTVSYAWDILVELASISVLPDTETLAARDMVYMHCAELEAHLRAIIAEALLARPGAQEIKLNWSIDLRDLLRLNEQGLLVPRAVEAVVPKSPDELIAMLAKCLGSTLARIVLPDSDDDRDIVLAQLKKREDNFAELLDEGFTMRQAQTIADTLVSFGLRAGYGVWFAATEDNVEARSSLRKNILFCTRILLDEARWRVCRDAARLAIELVRRDNEQNGAEDPGYGTYMLKANWFWCRRKLDEDIREEVEAWDTSKIHPRYEFLKMVLLERYDDAVRLAQQLLKPEPGTGSANMCAEEFNEWPILEFFRESKEYGRLGITAAVRT
ncbi:MAG TPA: hypothetical protein VGS08_02265 [Candidatus Saccharimonadales bacterium]|nr:hypothetical protein [Candidatus Saccharimonadales bacterium]